MKQKRVLILGYGEMGHAMEHLISARHDVRICNLGTVVQGYHTTLGQKVSEAHVILFCLPVNPHREIAGHIVPYLLKDSLCLTIAKELDESEQTAAQIFGDIFGDKHQYGVVYGQMISEELRAGQHGFANAVLCESTDFTIIQSLFLYTKLVCQQASDMRGRSWSVILKNVYALMFGVADELGLGKNMRDHLMVTAIAELSGIVQSFGGKVHTPVSYAGLGDLVTTGTSEESHHHTLVRKLALGDWSGISGEGVPIRCSHWHMTSSLCRRCYTSGLGTI